MTRTLGWLPLLSVALSLGCCTSPECEPEALPYRGEPRTIDELFTVAQYSAKHECCEPLYAQLSARSQEEHSELKFCLFWAGIEIPEPYEYRLEDVVAKGTLIGAIPGPVEGEEFIYVEYDPDGEEGPAANLLAQILVLKQEDPGTGDVVPRIGLQDQIDRIEAKKYEYYWDAGY